MDSSKPTNSIKPVVITGGSSGIGFACAMELDRRGVPVFAAVRSEEARQRLKQSASNRLTTIELDVTDADSIAAAARQVAGAVGQQGIHGLVNNAGVVVVGPLEFMPLDRLRRQFEVNVFGQIAVTQAFLPLLRAGRGRIVNISSVSGRVAPPYFGPYTSSKFALEALSDVLRVELRHWGISVSVVEPSNTATPIWQKARSASDELLEALRPALAERLSEADRRKYEADFQAMQAATKQMTDSAMPVEKVVRAVLHALYARRPRTRYPVGGRSRAASLAARFLPDRWRDWILRRSIGLP